MLCIEEESSRTLDHMSYSCAISGEFMYSNKYVLDRIVCKECQRARSNCRALSEEKDWRRRALL